MGPVLAGVLAARGSSALVFHGDDGLDELTTTGPSAVWVVRDGQVFDTRFNPAAIGIPRCVPEDLRGGDPPHNAAVVRSVLAGERGPVRETVLLNAAAALVAEAGAPEPARLSQALADGYARAAAAVDSGTASALLDRWVQASRRLASLAGPD
jgi:anthranilate phosphoribosyltransferase